MVLKLFNTLGRKKQVFKPLKAGEVGMYECGPTVYSNPHIGNMLRYIFGDILTRVLTYEGFKVKRVMNVTDVGHLTSDADEGEDKIEKAAAKEGKRAEDIANFYWKVFREDFKKLNIQEPSIWCKATEHIKEQIALIKKLEEKGYTYKTSDGIYFDTSKFKAYGKFALLNKENIKAGARIEIKEEKKNKTDFALWKFSSSQERKRQQEWNSPWGVGFPGWHIECSAMSMKYLGETIDIHTGGIDNMFPHHENEIAQSESATGKKFVNYWLHNNFLTLKGEKVSKSKGGLFTISELEEKGFSPLVYRYFILTGSYRQPIEFSLEILEKSKTAYERMKNIIFLIKEDKDEKINKKYIEEFTKAIEDDLNTPKALAVLWRMLRDEKAENKLATIKKIDEVLGLKLLEREKIEVPEEIRKLAEDREKARKMKDFKLSDEFRDKIKAQGFQVNDLVEGYEIKKL